MSGPRALVIAGVLAAGAALADRNITVNGYNNDWAGATTCTQEASNDGSPGLELLRTCMTNNNSSGSNNFLFVEYETRNNRNTKNHTYYGFNFDKTDDGFITSADELWVFHFAPSPAAPVLEVRDPITFALRTTYANTNNCGGSGATNGWSVSSVNKIVEGSIAYGCLGLAYGADTRLIQLGLFPTADLSVLAYYNGTADTVVTAAPPPDVIRLTAVAKNAANVLTWNNPTLHAGVLVLGAQGGVPNTAPTKGSTYSIGQTLGNATVLYFDDNGSSAATFTESGLTNGTRYFYKVYNHHQHRTYSAGNAPTSSGIFSEPTSRTAGSPLWCYSFGFPSLQRPTSEAAAAAFTANQSGTITASRTDTAVEANDGLERFRPVQLSGPVQARFPLLDLSGFSTKMIVTGDQTGRAYAINSQTGAVAWTANGGTPLGNSIQHFVMPYSASGTAPWDRLLVGTRNNSTTTNKVYSLLSTTGAIGWTYAPNNLDIISGGMVVHNGRLYVPARSAGNTQASLRVLDVVSGAQVAALSLGDIDYDLNRDQFGTLYVTTNSGTVYGVDTATNTVSWSQAVGATSAPVFVTGNGFVASLKSGSVARYQVQGTTVTQLWSTPIAGPTGVVIYYMAGGVAKYYVGSSDGHVYQLSTAGAVEKSITVSDQATGMPTVDSPAARLHVGTLDGRLCSYPVPFP